MRLPIRNKKGNGEVRIPDLLGGMNLRDCANSVNDNQITDCLNMWKKDGVLKTRPGITQKELAGYYFEERHAGKSQKHDIYLYYGTEKLQLITVPILYNNNSICDIAFYLINSRCKITLPSCSPYFSAKRYFVVEKDNYIYCFISGEKNNYLVEKCEFSSDCIYPKTDADPTYKKVSWSKITDEDIYIPTVMAHCKPLGKKSANPNEVTGTMIDGYNIIGDYYKMVYNSFNCELITDSKTSHMMCYHLLEDATQKKYIGSTVKVVYTTTAGAIEHIVNITKAGDLNFESAFGKDGIKVGVYANRVWFYYLKDGKEEVKFISDGGMDDIEITAPYISKDKENVFYMSQSEWFGGGTAGLVGGTRLFLSGHPDKKNLVLWSGLDNPLYFPENCYFYVGRKDSSVTGFGRENDKLIIFKENEIWATEYYQNSEITAENLIDQTVVDYAASSAYFPLTQIHNYIGCPYSKTIQLCNNRLVWLAGDKKVYSLVNNSYNRNSIYQISEMIQPKLDKTDTTEPSSAIWQDYYILNFKEKFFLMDYKSYGYTYVSSYSKTEDANKMIPWFYWEVPYLNGELYFDNDLLITNDTLSVVYSDGLCSYIDNFNDETVDVSNAKGKEKINSYFKTKIFDFSRPNIRKNFERLDLQLFRNEGEPIKVELITDGGSEENEVVIYGENNESPECVVENVAVVPCIRNVSKVSLKLECDGSLAVCGIILKYRYVGDVR